ncbi:hypothetical protein ACIBCA_28260 [Kitasatospora sp. NPDC051170]|uniref:hypothetical protein n=1 Tax=Kitasatospora sp. NPDC051170 TaxID=3364056 RepID=UPI003790918A
MNSQAIVPGAGLALIGYAIAFDIRNAAKWWQLFNYQYRNSDMSLRGMRILGAFLALGGTAGVVLGLLL